MKLEPRVKDGTPCKLGTRNVCLGGICQKVGCDWKFDSDAIEDACGICQGDGTHCEKVEDTYTELRGNGYVEITTIPKHSRNIKIEELAETGNTIAISGEDHSTFFLNGAYQEQSDGEYNFGKRAIGVYNHPEPQKEELYINGPITEDLVIYVVFYGDINPGIKYRYYITKEGSNYLPNYHWEFLQWEACSVECGGGIRISEPKCMEEKAGEVSNSFCKPMPKPERKEEHCNEVPCSTRWRSGPWSKCSECIDGKVWKHREVQCMRKAGGSIDEEAVTDNKECKERQPPSKQICESDESCNKQKPKHGTSKLDIKIGTIVKDTIPKEEIKLIEVPIIPLSNNMQSKLSDEAYEKLGDRIPVKVEENKAKVYTGNDALAKEKKLKENHN